MPGDDLAGLISQDGECPSELAQTGNKFADLLLSMPLRIAGIWGEGIKRMNLDL